MPLYRKMKSPLGYQNLTNSSFDSYGVDHSGFTTRDELEYQFARQERENLLMDQEQQNKVTDHFTQYGHNFWGTPSENNFGFGSSNISENIERLSKQFMTPPSSSTSFLDQSLIEEPQATASLFDTPVGYQSLLDDSSNNFLEESTSYPTSSYNSMALETPQSLGISSVRAPATTSLTGGGLNPNAFDSSLNNFSYPNALGTGGGTLTERMAAILKAREMPYNSLSDDTTGSMGLLSSDSYNSSQYEPSSSTDESWFNSLFGSKPAFGATLSSQGINNEPTGVSMPSDEELSKALSRHIPALREYEGKKDKIYIDSKNYATVGIGARLMPKKIMDGFFEEYIPDEEKEKLITALTLTEDLFKSGKMKEYYNYDKQQNLFKKIANGEDVPELELRPAEKGAISYIYQYNMSDEQMERFVKKHYQEEAFNKLRKFLKYKNIDYSKLPSGMQEILLDIAYNAGVSTPLYKKIQNKDGSFTETTYWNKLGDYLAKGDYYKALSEIYRNVQDSRNNYLLLRGMQDHGYLSDADIIKITKQLATEDNFSEKQGKQKRGRISKDNYDYYQKRFNLPVVSPF